MRTKFLAAIVLSGAVLGISASAFAAQDNATRHSNRAAVTKQIDPRYYDESADQGYAPYTNQQSQGSFAVGGFH